VFCLIGKFPRHSREEIEEMFHRDRFFIVLEAKEYGLVDDVLGDMDDFIIIDDIKA
jgi:ATP-dependent Clp protease protease subunit